MPLGLRTASGHVVERRSPLVVTEDQLEYDRDLLAQFGLTLDQQRMSEGRNISYGELAELALGPPGARPVGADLVILAYALPDLRPDTAIAAHVSYALGGTARCLAISEQGLAAPFTALRIADAYARSGRCREVVLLVLEQTTLPHADPILSLAGAAHPLRDSAAALILSEPGADHAVLRLRQIGIVQPEGDPAGWLSGAVDRARPDRPGRTGRPGLLVAGPWLDGDRLGDWRARTGLDLHQVPAGSYCTSVWLELGRYLPVWTREHELVVLADRDPRSGQHHFAVFGRRPEPARSGPAVPLRIPVPARPAEGEPR